MAEARCHYCRKPAEEECPTCGRLYCLDHGDDVCLRCLAPESALPSGRVYRGSVVALLAATAVTAFLIISPPASESRQDTARPVPTPTPSFLATATPTPRITPVTVTPGAGTPVAPSPTVAATPAASPTPAAPTERTHTVVPGDTLSAIAVEYGTTVEAIMAINPGLTPETLQIGTTLRIPPAQ
jgi:LysM repeat protein